MRFYNKDNMELTKQQNEVFKKIKAFMESDASVFILRGYAGTGKTTMVKVVADYGYVGYEAGILCNCLKYLKHLVAGAGYYEFLVL